MGLLRRLRRGAARRAAVRRFATRSFFATRRFLRRGLEVRAARLAVVFRRRVLLRRFFGALITRFFVVRRFSDRAFFRFIPFLAFFGFAASSLGLTKMPRISLGLFSRSCGT